MTQRERLQCAFELGTPDRVPVTWELVDRCAFALTGCSGWRAQCDAHRRIGSAIFNLQGVGPVEHVSLGPGYSDETVEVGMQGPWSVLERRLTTPGGMLVARSLHGGIPGDPLVYKITEKLVKTREDYGIYADYLDEVARTAEYTEGNSREALDYVRDDGLVNWWVGDSTYHIAMIRPDAEFLMDLIEAPDLMAEMFTKASVLTRRRIEAFNASAADAIVFDICWASTSLVSPAIVERFILPEVRWVIENVRRGKYVVLFITGRMREILPMMVDAGPHAIQHLDVLGDCDLAEVKRAFGRRVCLMGNYSPVILAKGTVAQARAEARRCLEAAGPDAFVLTTSDEVPADAKLENLRAVVDEASRWTPRS